MSTLGRFIYEEDAMGTVEVVLIAAVLIGLGLVFKKSALTFVTNHTKQISGKQINIENLDK